MKQKNEIVIKRLTLKNMKVSTNAKINKNCIIYIYYLLYNYFY